MRKIIHIDMDAFFAAVEMRDHPPLRHRPIAVGGEAGRGGVIATANYLARKYGVRSAMPSWIAMERCPDLLILPPNFTKYEEESEALHAILRQFSPLIEPLSLDEAYIDVSKTAHHRGSATLIGQEIQRSIWKERGLTASVGIAPNKFLAKIATEQRKPHGLSVIAPHQIGDFMQQLPIEKLYGIGEVMAKKLHQLNIKRCGELQQVALADLYSLFGNRGWSLYNLCRGIDHDQVIPDRLRHSLSVESTLSSDICEIGALRPMVVQMLSRLKERYQKIHSLYLLKQPFIKIKFSDFTCTTVTSELYREVSVENFLSLFQIGWERRKLPMRLLGIGATVTAHQEGRSQQLTLF